MKKAALITGGASGLGLEMANYLGEDGYELIIIDRDESTLNIAVKVQLKMLFLMPLITLVGLIGLKIFQKD